MRLLTALLTLSLAATLAPAAPAADTAWTVLVYMAADNNLAEAGLKDLNEMEKVGSTDRVNVVVQFDGSAHFTPATSDTCRFLIKKDDDPKTITSPVVTRLGEADMGDPRCLEDFLAWGIKHYPAERYAVVVWNHGNGWYPDDAAHGAEENVGPFEPMRAIASDESSGRSIATTSLADVLARTARTLGRPIDVVGFDACLMGMAEVWYQLRDVALVGVGSEKTAPGDGWAYDEWLPLLNARPDCGAEDLGRMIVETYAASYNKGSQGTANVTQSAVRLSGSAQDAFATALDRFAESLLAHMEAQRDTYRAAIAATQDFKVRSWFGTYFVNHRDLYDFARKIKGALPAEGDVAAAADGLMEAIGGADGLVIANGITDVSENGSVKDAHGVAIYLPMDGYEVTYRDLAFARLAWYRFIDALNLSKLISPPAGGKALSVSKELLFGSLHGAR